MDKALMKERKRNEKEKVEGGTMKQTKVSSNDKKKEEEDKSIFDHKPEN